MPNLDTLKLLNSDINDLNQMYKSEIYQMARNSQFPANIIKWNDLKIVQINETKCLNFSYIRQMQNKPETYSEFFIFWLGMSQISLNTEYRICDSLTWKNDIEMSICSYKLK